MNRRDFIKSLGVVSVGTVVTTPNLIQGIVTPEAVKFEQARLRRLANQEWVLTFSADELLKTKLEKGKELVAEIGDYTFLLKQLQLIDFTLREGRIYEHTVTGLGWEQLTS